MLLCIKKKHKSIIHGIFNVNCCLFKPLCCPVLYVVYFLMILPKLCPWPPSKLNLSVCTLMMTSVDDILYLSTFGHKWQDLMRPSITWLVQSSLWQVSFYYRLATRNNWAELNWAEDADAGAGCVEGDHQRFPRWRWLKTTCCSTHWCCYTM